MLRHNGRLDNSPPESSSTPIYLEGTPTVGCTVGNDRIARWGIRSRKGHLLRVPTLSICKDRPILREAEQLGATHVVVWDADTRTSYATELANFWKHGFPVRRGHGDQVGLSLDYWSVNGETPKAERRAAVTNKERIALQPSLFGA